VLCVDAGFCVSLNWVHVWPAGEIELRWGGVGATLRGGGRKKRGRGGGSWVGGRGGVSVGVGWVFWWLAYVCMFGCEGEGGKRGVVSCLRGRSFMDLVIRERAELCGFVV